MRSVGGGAHRRRTRRRAAAVIVGVVAVAVGAFVVVRGHGGTSPGSHSGATSPGAHRATGKPTSVGVYVADFFDPPSPEVLRDPDVDGFFQAYSWADIEPSSGDYRWEKLDAEVSAIRGSGKLAAIALDTGQYTPLWAEPEHATFVVAPHNGRTEHCREITVPFPWNAAYQDNLHRAITALHDHLVARGLYSTVTQVKLTGVNEYTEETRMPAERDDIACAQLRKLDGSVVDRPPPGTTTTNAPLVWRDAGYRRSVVERAWETIATFWATAFPDKTLAMPVILNGGFPNIDDSGTILRKRDSITTQDLYRFAANRWGSRFMLMQNGLRDAFTSAAGADARREGASIGFQLAQNVFGTKGSLPPRDSFDAAIDHGLQNNMIYLEVFAADVAPYRPSLSSARHRISTSSA